MFNESAAFYDLLYANLKNYSEESAHIAALLRTANPACHSVLDVGCGTGEHLRHLAHDHGFRVDGLDLDPEILEVAARKNPGARFWAADMGTFDLSERYDAVVCLFSSIGYLRTLERVERGLRCFRRHLTDGGVVVVEPWFAPGQLDHGYVNRQAAEHAGRRVERVSHTEIDGRLSRLHFEYTLTDDTGTRTATEIHELGLFTPDEMLAAFEKAGLHATYAEPGLTGRGLYVAHGAA